MGYGRYGVIHIYIYIYIYICSLVLQRKIRYPYTVELSGTFHLLLPTIRSSTTAARKTTSGESRSKQSLVNTMGRTGTQTLHVKRRRHVISLTQYSDICERERYLEIIRPSDRSDPNRVAFITILMESLAPGKECHRVTW